MDKEGLEGGLYEAQQNLSQLEIRKNQLEVENQDLLVRKENLQGKCQIDFLSTVKPVLSGHSKRIISS